MKQIIYNNYSFIINNNDKVFHNMTGKLYYNKSDRNL